MASRNTAALFLGGSRIQNYRPSLYGGGWQMWQSGQRGFRLQDVELMRRDPQIIFGGSILAAPIFRLRWVVKSPNEELALFIDETLKHFWRHDLVHALRFLAWGYCGGEPLYKIDPETERIQYDRLRDFYPLDLTPLETNGRLTGVKVRGGTDADNQSGQPILRTPRLFWAALEPEFGGHFGRSKYSGAWAPWMEKTGRHGAVDVRRLWFVKNAVRGGTVRHPPGVIELGNGAVMSNQDYARELLEKFESGGILVLPNAKDPDSGEYQWVYEPPAANGDVRDLREYPKDLDLEMLKGMTIPPEVVQAASAGSGWSGRSVPFLVFLTGEDLIAFSVLDAVDAAILRPLAWQNFGTDNYKIEPQSLTYLAGDDPGQAQKPERPGQGPPQPAPNPQPKPTPPIQLSSGSPWTQHTGERGGVYWQHAQTGEKRYQEARPEDGQGGDTDKPTVAGRLKALSARAAELPRKVKEKAADFAVAKFKQFEERYGRKGALVVMGAVVLLTPVPAPGTSLLPVAVAEGVLAARKLLRGKKAVQMSQGEPTPEELMAAVREYLQGAYEEWGEDAPEVTDEQIRAALEAAAQEPGEDLQLSQGPAVSDEIRRKVRAQAKRRFPVRLGAAHAPAGGVSVAGKHYEGGQFIPAEVMAKASPQERAAVEGAPQDQGHRNNQVAIARGLAAAVDRAPLSAGQKADYKAALATVAFNLPPEAVARVQRHVKRATFHPDTRHLTDALVAKYPTMAALFKPGQCAGGAYAHKEEALYLDGPGTGVGGKPLSTAEVYAHEFGHAVDGPYEELSRSDEWQAVYQAEIAGGRLSPYAATHPAEGWAEFARVLYSGQYNYAKIERHFPRCAAFWKEQGLWPTK